MKYIMRLVLGVILMSNQVLAHEMTPTYPKLEAAFADGIYKTTMEMFNKRQDVEWYEIGVFDSEWNSIPFVSSYKIMNIKYLGHVRFDIYIRAEDKNRATYVCSKSKLRKESTSKTAVSSRICSKFK